MTPDEIDVYIENFMKQHNWHNENPEGKICDFCKHSCRELTAEEAEHVKEYNYFGSENIVKCKEAMKETGDMPIFADANGHCDLWERKA